MRSNTLPRLVGAEPPGHGGQRTALEDAWKGARALGRGDGWREVKLPEPRQLPDGRWWMQYSAPPGPGGKRRQPRVYGRTAKECRENYVTAMGDIQAGRLADDRRTKFADYLDRRLRWWESEDDIKPSTLASYREAIEFYFKPGLGHLRLAELRDHHFRDLAAAMRKINTPVADGDLSDLRSRWTCIPRSPRSWPRLRPRPWPPTCRAARASQLAILVDCLK
jgi:hypothetical protein